VEGKLVVLGIQILGIVFGAFLLYFTFLHHKRKELNNVEFVFWSILWVIFIYLVLFPNALDFIVISLNLVRTLDLFTILAFMFLIILTFYNYLLSIKNRGKLERAVRAIALEKPIEQKRAK
jgi:hypothetical protein